MASASAIIPTGIDGANLGTFNNLFVNINPTNYAYYYDDCFNSSSWDQRTNGTGAAISQIPPDSSHPGTFKMSTGTTNSGAVNVNYTGNQATNTGNYIFGGGNFTYIAYINIVTLATAGEDYDYYIGLGDGWIFGTPTSGIYFRYNRSTSANWLFVTNNSSSVTSTTSSTAVTTGWHKMKISGTTSQVTFSVDGVTLGTTSTNLPTGAISLNMHLVIKSAGTTSRDFYQDYFSFIENLTSAR